MSGTIDPNGLAGGPALDNDAPSGSYSWTTYPERLLEAGVSFKFYHQDGAVTGVNPIQRMKQYAGLSADSELYKHTLASSPVGQFEYDAMNGRLPTVSWIFPPSSMNEHPANLPAAGASFVSSLVDAIAANPEVWAKTAFILSYDENDGLFDHVVPPTPQPGTPDEFVTKASVTGVDGAGLPVGLGFRVPCIVVSPWTVGGWVSSEVADHTSQLRLLEKITGVQETNISEWRRRTTGDLTSAFRFDSAVKQAPELPGTIAQYNLAQYEVSQLPKPTIPPATQQMPSQEPGHRPHTS